MAIITGITKRVDIPHEPNEWMELRRLSWRQLELAETVGSEEALKRVKKMGGDMLASLQKMNKKTEQVADPSARYDQGTVLEAGIVNWSYDAEVNKENIDNLDSETAKWAFDEILSLNKPRTEADRKNA